MEVITVCRTLNEERNIERFCEEYGKISDKIIISDGGSEDRTRELAGAFDKVTVVGFHKRIYRDSGAWRNPHGHHINSMIDLAEYEGADWIIYDDCDSAPNRLLKEQARAWMDDKLCDCLMVPRMYLYKDEGWFPKLTTGSCLWAWRPSFNVRASETDPWSHHMNFTKSRLTAKLDFPLALLHYSWPDEDEIRRKIKFYKETREIPSVMHPTEMGGSVASLPEWAIL